MRGLIGASVTTGLRLAVSIVCAVAVSQGQQTRVVSLTGTYDLDQDGLSEFLSLEKVEDSDRYPRRAVYYEIDADGAHSEVWRFTPDRPLKDARLANTDGDGTAEVALMDVPAPGTVFEHGPWLHLLPWKDGRFAPEPEFQWGDQLNGKDLALRPSHFAVLDLENDGQDEIAVSLASPRREVILLTRRTQEGTPGFATQSLPLSEDIVSGYGHILLVAGDHNQDGFADLLALNRELNWIEMQLFEGTGSALLPGVVHKQSTADLGPSFTGILPSSLHTVDADGDGREDLLVPFRTRVALAISLEPDRLRLTPVEPELTALFAFPPAGLQSSHLNDILLARAELGITGRKVRQLKMEAVTAPEPTPPERPARKVKRLELEPAPREEQPTLPEPGEVPEKPVDETIAPADTVLPEKPEEETGEPPSPRRVRKLALESVTRDEVSEPPELVEIEIPPGIQISDTARVGQTFNHPLALKEGEKLHAFRPTNLPGGASFDPVSLAITWTPTMAQVGYHSLTYEVEYELAGEVDVEETGETVQVVRKTETRSVQRHIIVLGTRAE